MSKDSPSAPGPAGAKLSKATDSFIGYVLPDWLKNAKPAQINRLRDSFKRHQASQGPLRAATAALIPLPQFAAEQFGRLLADRLPVGTDLQALHWLQVRRGFAHLPVLHWPSYGPIEDRQPALLRLMQNFHEDAEVLTGSGLVLPNSDAVLLRDPQQLPDDCRSWDIGARYQALLDQVFTPATCTLLAEDKRAGLLLAIDIAALKGELDSETEAALRAVIQAHPENTLRAYPGLLTALGSPISDALAFQLRNEQGQDSGVVLYLPSDPKNAFRYFETWADLNDAMTEALRQESYRNYFSQLVELKARPSFLGTLETRLKDTVPDLQLDAATDQGEVFERLVALQVKRVKDDARLLLVPTGDVDLQATKDRLQAWKDAGLGLLNLAGMFIPVVGAILLGQFVVQTLSEVYEGAVDWYHGHQHEALEHMLGVAEALAVAAAVGTAAGLVARGFQRSAFVDGLEPVTLEGGEPRLWQRDLKEYEITPVSTTQGANGLFAEGDHQCIRVGERYYRVHRPDAQGPWRLRHARREDAFGPQVEFNGDRGWRLRHERPLEIRDSARLLDLLWPQREPLSSERAGEVLAVAGTDTAQLRGLLVAGHRPPVNLRESLRRFQADARIEAFFEQMHRQVPASDDQDIQRWCLAQPDLQGLDAQALRERVLALQAPLREQLMSHLTETELAPDPLRELVRRDFPGLPPAYAAALIEDVAEAQRDLAVLEQRLPMSLATQARELLLQVRLSRAIEGLYLPNSYSDQTGELVLAMLSRLPHWPRRLNLELRQGTENGRRVALLNPQVDEQATTIMVYSDGEFHLYDHRGLELDNPVAAPRGLFEGIIACLTPEELARLELTGDNPAQALRTRLVSRLPGKRTDLCILLGWRPSNPRSVAPQRLSNGRIGYPLSGRGSGQRAVEWTLRDRIRELFWGLSEAQVDSFLHRLLLLPGSPFENLLRLETQYHQIDVSLNRWASAELNDRRRGVRQLTAGLMRRAWRMQGERAQSADGAVDGARLDLSGLPLRTLPELPAQADFGDVSELNLGGLQVDGLPTTFLNGFSALRRLSLNHNLLLRLPAGLGRLGQLTELRLAGNRIRLDLDGVQSLARLNALRYLDLSFNPLGSVVMRFNQLPQLRSIRLRRCGLLTWPEGLEICGFLDSADLRQNQIARIPDSVMQMPPAYRRSFQIADNPISTVERDRFYADRPHPHEAVAPPPALLPDAVQLRSRWLERGAEAARDANLQAWDRLSAMPEGDGLFELLDDLEHTQEYRVAAGHLGDQVWALLRAIDTDEVLRLQVFDRARVEVTCVDSAAARFSDLQVLMLIHQADGNGAGDARGMQLLGLGRRLFRLDELGRYARGDIAERIAQLPPADAPDYASARAQIDEIEIDLHYRVHLATELDLPLQPRHMQFESLARVSNTQLQQAVQRVRAAEATRALARSISQREFWLSYLRAEHPRAFAAIEENFANRGSELDGQQGELSSEAYRQRWNELRIERDGRLQALALLLTQEALGREVAHPG
ncbi:NEL-type E3 ubiquitin ligase domain-containing protein [Pseudomonas sp. NPDC089752]|uniref:NEL-type E3 ubiquitin ligase domain-containing protein n=1 Tax=Pseudomonas sp. NPDC089752 TaxID=3364472 RepID=UPI00381A27DD